jgi:enamine deaminase RidA (YjgF/YER057c/UK114 family)
MNRFAVLAAAVALAKPARSQTPPPVAQHVEANALVFLSNQVPEGEIAMAVVAATLIAVAAHSVKIVRQMQAEFETKKAAAGSRSKRGLRGSTQRSLRTAKR